jgi:hypothetical protein
MVVSRVPGGSPLPTRLQILPTAYWLGGQMRMQIKRKRAPGGCYYRLAAPAFSGLYLPHNRARGRGRGNRGHCLAHSRLLFVVASSTKNQTTTEQHSLGDINDISHTSTNFDGCVGIAFVLCARPLNLLSTKPPQEEGNASRPCET